MKQFKLKSAFVDKVTDERYEIDSIYESNDDKRIEELKKSGVLGEEIKPKKEKKSKTTSEKSTKK